MRRLLIAMLAAGGLMLATGDVAKADHYRRSRGSSFGISFNIGSPYRGGTSFSYSRGYPSYYRGYGYTNRLPGYTTRGIFPGSYSRGYAPLGYGLGRSRGYYGRCR
jgi:hypothetical protein